MQPDKIIITILLIFSSVLSPFAQNRPEFSLKFKDEVSPYEVTGMFLLPGESVELETVYEKPASVFDVKISEGFVEEITAATWKYTAPETPGLYRVTIINEVENDSILINCFVLFPLEKMNGIRINGYRVGNYPEAKSDVYNKPRGFIEVTPENEDTFLSPHFQLKDFKCKQQSNYPKYIILRERLLYKLEMIIEHLQDQGIACTGLEVMSGYRTPFYNQAIGNVKYSRHVYGDASDIYLDEEGDGQMDDLNKDGISDKKDARVLYNLINNLRDNPWYAPFLGGLGIYGKTASNPAFIHVDLRGSVARWGE